MRIIISILRWFYMLVSNKHDFGKDICIIQVGDKIIGEVRGNEVVKTLVEYYQEIYRREKIKYDSGMRMEGQFE